MLLESIKTEGFRNLNGTLECSTGLNIIVGNNGLGKTNWLEAIYLLATTKSFKTARLQEAISFGSDLAIVRGNVRQSAEIVRELQVAIQGSTKQLTVNKKKETVQQYLGQLNAFVFNADELSIIRGQPDARRKFLDGGIVSLHPPFVQTFSDYGKVVRQKNVLLQQAKDREYSIDKTAELLVPWNLQLVQLASRIHRARLRFVDRINQVLEKKLFAREEVTIKYISSLEGKGDMFDYEALLNERLNLRVQAEMAAGHSLIGTHRDDLEILFDQHDLRKYGSAGQQRSALLLLLLANITVYNATRGEYPLFLLDDIDAELDHTRIGQLLEYLDGKTQTFITTSKPNIVDKFGADAMVKHIT